MLKSFYFRQPNWVWQIAILSVVLGMLLAAALKTQQSVRSVVPTTRFSGLVQAFLNEREKNKLLQQEVAAQRAKVAQYEQARGEETARLKLMGEELKRSKLLAGLLPVEGKGIEITLQDYPGKIPPNTPAFLKDQYIIHDVDLRDIVNELFANGAEAISIRDADTEQRIIANTAIRCVGGPIQVNQVEMAAPFVISAIGPPSTMKSGLEMIGGLLDNWRPIEGLASKMVKIRQKDHLVIPAYSGNTSTLFIWSKPLESEGTQ